MSKFSPLGFCQRATGMSKPDSNIDRWELHHFIEVAGHLNLLKPDTSSAARLARSFKPDPSRPRSAASHPCLPARHRTPPLQFQSITSGVSSASHEILTGPPYVVVPCGTGKDLIFPCAPMMSEVECRTDLGRTSQNRRD